MQHYLYQKFLMNCDYESIDLKNKIFAFKENFLQITELSLQELDKTIENEKNFVKKIKTLNKNTCIVIKQDRILPDNSIIKKFSENILKAFIFYFEKYGFICYWLE